jgi:hypothetical protein
VDAAKVQGEIMMRYRFLVIHLVAVMFLGVATRPAYAAGPVKMADFDLLQAITDLLAPLVDVLDDFIALLETDYETTAENYFGLNWQSTDETGQAFVAQTAPVDYYADGSLPDEVRDLGYSLESVVDLDTTSMSAADFASWLGGVVALPFLYARGFQIVASLAGPVGLFVSWLLVGAVWVTLVYFIEFLISTAGTIFSVGSRILELIGLVKP